MIGRKLLIGAMLLMCGTALRAAPIGTAFTYQGFLNSGGAPANGLYDLTFTLFDQPTLGNQVGATVTNLVVTASNGVFTAAIDFGASPWTGEARWLEVGVRSNGSTAAFSKLSPRQALTPAAASIYASTASLASNLAGPLPSAQLAGLYSNVVQFSAASNSFAGTFSGNGSGLTGLNGGNIQPGTVTSNQLDAATWQLATNKSIQVINVRDFGARGDGLTDDTLALANAWAAWLSSGGTLYFPPGRYLDSGTHASTSFVPNEPEFRDGRMIRGMGGAIWQYTGQTRFLYFSNSTPDIVGLEFRCNTAATNGIYVTLCQGKPDFRDLFFNGWTNVSPGALVIDETDSPSLHNIYFYSCKIGLGLGYRCSNLRGDVETTFCGIGVAAGVLTDSFPGLRESHGIQLSILGLYSGTTLAVDGAVSACSFNGYFWNSQNAVTVGAIPGLSTNAGTIYSLALDNCFFGHLGITNPPIQIYGQIGQDLMIRNTKVQFGQPNPPAVVKCYNTGFSADSLDITGSYVVGTSENAIWFEDPAGHRISERALLANVSLNKPFGLYNWRNQGGTGGSGYLLDVLDAAHGGPLARLGVPATTDCSMTPFYSGLTLDYNSARISPSGGAPGGVVMTLTNSDLQLRAGTLVVETNSAAPVSTTPQAWMLIKTPDGQSWKVGLYQ